jgi:hypothetical protein
MINSIRFLHLIKSNNLKEKILFKLKVEVFFTFVEREMVKSMLGEPRNIQNLDI